MTLIISSNIVTPTVPPSKPEPVAITPNSVSGNSETGRLPGDSGAGGSKTIGNINLQSSILTLQKNMFNQIKEQNERTDQISGVSPVIKGIDMDKYSHQP